MTDRSLDRPLRIALALESSGPGGAENVVLRLAESLRAGGDSPVVVTLRRGWMTERAEGAGLPVWITPQQKGLDPGWVPRFAQRLRRERIDVLHSHEFAMNVYGGAAAVLARVRHVGTVHGHAWIAERGRRVLAYRVLQRLGMQTVAVSAELSRYLAARVGLTPAAIAVVRNGVEIAPARSAEQCLRERAAARSKLGLPLEAPLAVAVGNLYAVKDHASLLRAAAQLAEPAHVAIAGRGEEAPRLQRLAAELDIADRVHLLGLIDDVSGLLRAADVFVQPSRAEGLPLAVLEAMAAGLPVVASDVGGIGEAVLHGETGLLVPPRDPESLARALEQTLGAPGRSAALGTAGRRRAAREFSIAAMARRYRALYTLREPSPGVRSKGR